MPNLGDYLGHLVAELTIARMQADLEAVRMAELYASHPLLRNMPVPRFRLPTVEFEVPVVVEHMDEARSGESARGGTGVQQLRKQFDKVLSAQLSKNRVRLKADHRAALTKALDEETARLELPTEVAGDTNRIADRLARVATDSLREGISAEKADKVEVELGKDARLQLLRERSSPPRLLAQVTTTEIREAGPEHIVRIRLKVSEESMEMVQVESDGEMQDRLVPE